MIKIIAGVDLSMNSSGLSILVYDESKGFTEKEYTICGESKAKKRTYKMNHPSVIECKFYQILSDEAKGSNFSRNVKVTNYKREFGKETYSHEDLNKIISATRLASKIKELIKKTMEKYDVESCEVRMEGSVMSFSFKNTQSRLNDLTAFNSIVKMMLVSSPEFHTINIIAPTALKKQSTGNGKAKKEDMQEAFLRIFPKFEIKGKIDDVIDAFFLSYIEPLERGYEKHKSKK